MEKRLRSSLQNSAEEFLSSAIKIGSKAAKPSLKTLIFKITNSSDLISSLPLVLDQSITRSIDSFKKLNESNGNEDSLDSPITSPPSKRLRKSSRRKNNVPEELNDEEEVKKKREKVILKREFLIQSLEIYTYVAFLCITHPQKLFSDSELLPSVKALHDNLSLFENDSGLMSEIAKVCEEWWKEQLNGREELISQTLPFLLSKSLTLRKKVDVHRVYALREALCLFEFDDETIDDLKNLLLRCMIDPLYLKMDEGRRFIAFLFGLSGQLVKEALALIKSQIPFGRKSVLEAYADILFRAWKVAESSTREEIENGLLQALVEGAIYASSDSLAASVRRVLGGFVCQRTTDGVEKLLFCLTEPVIFRSLQVANSNVRKNALHLLLDVFPLEDPDATKDVKDALIEKQFFLLERLLLDECPDVRVVAVEGSCRILYLFWEIIPSSTITKTITKIMDDMSYDICTEVRLSTINGITYLLGNPQTHELLKVLLPRLGHLFLDRLLSVRVALADLLLTLSDIHTFHFHKVVGMDILLSSLSNDEKVVAQKITRLLMPAYFPAHISPEEACTRCITLIKRSPLAGARFCEFVFTEGSPLNFLLELVRVSVNLVVSAKDLDPNQIEGLLVALVNLCRSLATESSYKASLKRMLTGKTLKQLFTAGTTKHAQTAVFNIASITSVDDVTDFMKDCMVSIRNCGGLSLNLELQEEVRSVHKLMMSCGRFDEMFVALTELLQKAASGCRMKVSSGSSTHSVPNVKQKKPKLSMKCSTKSEKGKGNKTSSRDATAHFQEHYIVAAGAAWQMKDLLTSADSRHAVLKSLKLEVAFSALKLISEVSIEQCMHLEYIDTSPVLAYAALALHAELHNADLARTSDLGVKKTNTGDSNRCLLKGNVLEVALNHLFGCTKRLFTENEPEDLPKTCGCKPSDGESCFCDKKSMLNMVKMVAEVLKFIVDAITICPNIDHQRKCLQFASACIQVIIPTLRKHSQDLAQLSEDLKGTLLCLKSSFTYATKLLNVLLKSYDDTSSPLPEAFTLANNLLNLVTSIESYFGSKNASCLIPAIKPWVLDLILALGSSQLMTNTPHDSDPSVISQNSLCFLPWLKILGKLEYLDMCAHNEDEEASRISAVKKFSVFKEVIEMVVVLLRRNSKVLDSVGIIFLNGLATLLEREEYGLSLGIVHFVCVKLVRHEHGEWKELKVMLAFLHELYPQLRNNIKDSTNEEGRKLLENAVTFLEPVWTSYVSEAGDQ